MKLNCKELWFLQESNMSGSVPGKEQLDQAVAHRSLHSPWDAEQTMPCEPKTRDLAQALCLCCCRPHATAWDKRPPGSSIPLSQPQLSHNPCGTVRTALPTAVPCSERRSRRRETFLSFLEGLFPAAWFTHAQEGEQTLSYRGG